MKLLITDELMMARVASQIASSIETIRLCQSILEGKCEKPEYKTVDMEQIRNRLESEKWCLENTLEDIEEGLFEGEIDAIKKEFGIGGY